jgi:site-specific recombinase XerD
MLEMVLDEFINYLATVKNYSRRTLPTYRSTLRLFFAAERLKIPTGITPVITEHYMGKRIEKGMSVNTNASFMVALRAFLIFCNKRGYGAFQLEMFEVPRRVHVKLEYVTPDEVNRMVSVIRRERDRLLLLVLFTSGCRVSEVIQLGVENFNDNKFTVMAKGNKPHVYYFDRSVAERLQVYIQTENITSGAVFCTTTGKPIATPAVTHIVRKAAKLAKISHNVHPHQFRHGFATAALEAGADIRTIQEMLGHEQIQTTMRYAHVTDARMAETHDRFAPKLGSPFALPTPHLAQYLPSFK